MVNTEDFIKRLEIILEYYSLNASSFADKIGVQRSSLSHLLSGRNKPSLDFILKIIDIFPDVDLYWILNGRGSFPRKVEQLGRREKTAENAEELNIPAAPIDKTIPENLFSPQKDVNNITDFGTKKIEAESSTKESVVSEIDKIVIFYKNGTFKSYVPD
jgi:transcriptional regulator with XRE-family HTH domain